MRLRIIISTIFFIIYGMMCTIGSIYLVTWGTPTNFKSFMNFMLTTPINWDKLIMESIFYLLLNMIFWTTVVYLLTGAIQTIFRLTRKIKANN